MIRLSSLTLLFALFFVTACGQAPETAEKPQGPPNIIYILSDDHAEKSISAYDPTLHQTPNLDRIAEEGMLFRNSFVTNSICAPARAVILTGLYSHLNGKRDNIDVFDGSQPLFVKDLQANGYHTSVIGKWHLKSAPQGFDFWQVLIGQGTYFNPTFVTNGDTSDATGYTSTIITDQALAQLKSRAEDNQPFCMLYWHKAPHRNWMPDLKDLEGLTEKRYPLPSTLRDDYAGRPAAASADMRIADMFISSDLKVLPEYEAEDPFSGGGPAGYSSTDNWAALLKRFTPEQRAAYEPYLQKISQEYRAVKGTPEELEWRYQRYMQDYLSSIKSVDENVGRVLDYLEESGLDQNTIVIYSSDQGFYLGEHGWYDKRFMYEESLRTPLMIRYPGVTEPGSENSDLVLNLDMAPTILAAAGVEVPERMQGRSILPLLKGETPEDWRDHVYYHYYESPTGWHTVEKHEGVRGDRYKLIRFYDDEGNERFELFDLETDPKEMDNRIGDPELEAVETRLRDELEQQKRDLKVK